MPSTRACVYDCPGDGHPRAPLFHVTACDDTSVGVPVTPRAARSSMIASHLAGGTATGVPVGAMGPAGVVSNGRRVAEGWVESVMGAPEHAVSDSSRSALTAMNDRAMSHLQVGSR